jgi:DNA polymerase-3 subunit delta
MNTLELEQELDQGRILPLYFLYGEESYLIGETRKRIESLCLNPKTRDFNYDQFIGGEVPPERIIDAAKTLPVMAPWRVIVVKDAPALSDQQVESLVAYCQKPSTTTCLILLGEKVGTWRRYVGILEDQGRFVSFTHPRGKLLTRHIIRGASRMGKEIAVEAAGLIQELVGNNLSEIYQELNKLVSYVGEEKRIRVDDVEAVVSPVLSHTIFDLTRAMGMKKRAEALKILDEMVENGEKPLKILTMMVRQFRLIWMAKDMRSQGMKEKDIGKALGLPDFVLTRILSQLENFSPSELEEGYRRFSEADMALKSRSLSKRVVLENLIIRLCQE